ncbi:MAG: hypothetical protein LBG74_01000 [Spirochaetaceae bacterium]|jgi:hypothetical protein|nr:hypothetical protein [Spirochaetaceae bacterium]
MAKKIIFLLIVSVGLVSSGCATYSTVNGVQTPLGVYTSASINGKDKTIASYSIILGAITAGYEDFLEKVKGKDIDIIDTNYFGFYREVKAVAKR